MWARRPTLDGDAWWRRGVGLFGRPIALVVAVCALFYLLEALVLTFSVRLSAFPGGPCTRAPHADRLLHLIATQCSRAQPTFISITPRCTVVTATEDPTGCRALEIMLAPTERGFGMCTDAAFYVLHLGARIVPFSAAMISSYNSTCQHPQTRARLHLETIYTDALQGGSHLKNVMLVNSEHLFTFDAHKHGHVDLFVCKTRFCVEPMLAYVNESGFKAEVLYMGHSSLDPTAPIPHEHPSSHSNGSSNGGHSSNGSNSSWPGGVVKDYQRVLHVRGKSGLKHTQQTLECWRTQPEFPEITVVAFNYKLGHLLEFRGTPNIRFLPPMPANQTLMRLIDDARKRVDQVQAKPSLLTRAAFARQHRAQVPEQQEGGGSPASPTDDTPARPARGALAVAASTQPELAEEPAAGARRLLARRWSQGRRRVAPVATRKEGTSEHALTDEEYEAVAAKLRRRYNAVVEAVFPGASVPAFTEEEYQAAAAEFRKRHDAKVEAALREWERVIEEGPSVGGSIAAEELQRLQLESGIHICVSVREGFGHYLNEARAAGALIVTTDHPPMNELVRPGMGVLVAPTYNNSISIQSLGNYTRFNAFCTGADICKAVKVALSLSDVERRAMGGRAREVFLRERAEFERRLQILQAWLVADG